MNNLIVLIRRCSWSLSRIFIFFVNPLFNSALSHCHPGPGHILLKERHKSCYYFLVNRQGEQDILLSFSSRDCTHKLWLWFCFIELTIVNRILLSKTDMHTFVLNTKPYLGYRFPKLEYKNWWFYFWSKF